MNIDIIKNEFEIIKELKIEVEDIFKKMSNKITSLNELYQEYSLKNTSSELVLTLDSFHFQNKFIEIEYNNYLKLFKLFINRLYGDYYKFYKYIFNSIIQQLEHFSIKLNTSYPIYKDLEFKEYSFDIIINIHHDILNVVNELNSRLITSEHENKKYESFSSRGINIDNLVTVNNYKNIVLSEKIKLIVNCLKSYSAFQRNYLSRFLLKVKFVYAQISADIQIDKNQLINNELDKELLKNLDSPHRKSVTKILNDNNSPSASSESDTEENISITKKKKIISSKSIISNKLLFISFIFQFLCYVSTPIINENN